MPKLAMKRTVLVQRTQNWEENMVAFSGGVCFVTWPQRYPRLSWLHAIPGESLVGVGEAISGNREIRDWLMQNGYPELALTCHALHLDDSARSWLMANQHPHLMALVSGSEGDAQAIQWMEKFGFNYLKDVALGADNDDEAVKRLIKAGQREWAGIALKIRSVKNQIESDNNDMHKISRR